MERAHDELRPHGHVERVMTAPRTATPPIHAPVVFVDDVFAIIDDGETHEAEYLELGRRVEAHAENHPRGLGCVVVIPAGTKPPEEAQRKVIDATLTRLAPKLRALVWVVEERGFYAAITRSILVGLSLYGRRPYPTQVSSSLTDALHWLSTKLRSATVTRDAGLVADKIRHARAEYARR